MSQTIRFLEVCEETVSTQYTMLLDGVNEYSRLYHDPATAFHSYDSFSAGGWMRTASAGFVQCLMSKKQGTTQSGWTMYLVGGDIHVLLIANNSNRIRIQTNGYVFTLNTFFHVGFSYDGSYNASGVKFYVNGVEVPITINEDTLTLDMYSTFDMAIGAEFGFGNFFNGYLGYQRLWNIELSATDFLNEYNGGKMLYSAVQNANLVLDWRSGENANYLTASTGLTYSGWCYNNPLDPYQYAQGFTISMEYIDRTTVIP